MFSWCVPHFLFWCHVKPAFRDCGLFWVALPVCLFGKYDYNRTSLLTWLDISFALFTALMLRPTRLYRTVGTRIILHCAHHSPVLLRVLLWCFRTTHPYVSLHYENTPIPIHWKFYNKKKKVKFLVKIPDIFHISAQNIDCGYSLEPPRRGGSNEYPQSMFWAQIRKIMYTPVFPSFTI